MQTIKTKYLSATNTKPQRIKAQNSGGGHSITLSVHNPKFNIVSDCHGGNRMSYDVEMHKIIALELMKKLDWKGMMVGGSDDAKGGMVWVFHTMQDSLSPTIFCPGAKW